MTTQATIVGVVMSIAGKLIGRLFRRRRPTNPENPHGIPSTALIADAPVLLRVLSDVEWSGVHRACPSCYRTDIKGHAEHCELCEILDRHLPDRPHW